MLVFGKNAKGRGRAAKKKREEEEEEQEEVVDQQQVPASAVAGRREESDVEFFSLPLKHGSSNPNSFSYLSLSTFSLYH